jgi:hypothetical protein
MSLWLDSLGRRNWGGVDPEAPHQEQEEQARHILRHLAMMVPRSWWETAISNGINPRPDLVHILKALKRELEHLPELAAIISYPALVALPFTYVEREQSWEALRDSDLEIILAQTSTTLQSRPDLQQLGERVAQVAEEID